MKVKIERYYYQESLWSIFHKLNSSNDLIISITLSSYKRSGIESAITSFKSIGYKEVSKVSKKIFLYSAVLVRLVPLYQRLIIGPVKFADGFYHGRIKKAINAEGVDIIQYTDKDLEIMRDMSKILKEVPSLKIVDPKTYKFPMLRLSVLWDGENKKEYDDAKEIYDKLKEDIAKEQKNNP